MENKYGPPTKAKEVVFKVDVFKVAGLIKKWHRRKEERKRCERSSLKNSGQSE